MSGLDRYRLVAHLGRGGMADVYLAVVDGPSGSGFTKLAVVKRLREASEDDAEIAAMFIEEARILAQLRHPNIVQIIDVGEHEGKPMLAMEYLDGLSWKRIRQRASRASIALPLSIEVVAAIDMLSALGHAHALESWDGKRIDVVHRDVTPHNVVASVDGQVKVLDFGIAKSALRANVTRAGVIKGKLRYMSPEQARGETVGAASDLFSVGVFLWEASTQRRFWDGLDDAEVAARLVSGDLHGSPRSVEPAVPVDLDRICQRALAARAEDRYASAREMREDLERHLGDGVIEARRLLGPLVLRLAGADRERIRVLVEESVRDHPPVSFVAPARTVDSVVVEAPSLPVAPVARARGRITLAATAAAVVLALLLARGAAERSAGDQALRVLDRRPSPVSLDLTSDSVRLRPLPSVATASPPAPASRPILRGRPHAAPSSPPRGAGPKLDTSDPWAPHR